MLFCLLSQQLCPHISWKVIGKGVRITAPKSKNFPGKEPNFALNFIMWIEDFQSRGKNMECTKERNTSGTEPSVLQPFIGKY